MAELVSHGLPHAPPVEISGAVVSAVHHHTIVIATFGAVAGLERSASAAGIVANDEQIDPIVVDAGVLKEVVRLPAVDHPPREAVLPVIIQLL